MAENPKLFLSRTGYREVVASSVDAGSITGTTLAPNVVNSSITLLGTSAILPGSPITTTQPPLTDNTTIATTAYVDAAVAAGTGGGPFFVSGVYYIGSSTTITIPANDQMTTLGGTITILGTLVINGQYYLRA